MTISSDNLADRACQLTREFIGHACKVRDENPEDAQTPEQTAMILSLELSRIGMNGEDDQKLDILAGLKKGLNSLKLTDEERLAITAQIKGQLYPGNNA